MRKNKQKLSCTSSRTFCAAVPVSLLKLLKFSSNYSSLAESIFAKSSETLLNLAIVCLVNRSIFQFVNAFSAYFSSPNTRSTGKFVWSTISTPRFWFKFSNYSRNGIIWPTILTGHWNMQRRRYPIGNSAFWHDIQCSNLTRFQTI